MTRFRYSSLLVFALFISCSAVQSQRYDKTVLTGTRFDVDINGRIIVADGEKNVLRQYSREQSLLKEIGGTGWNDSQFDQPAGVAEAAGDVDAQIACNATPQQPTGALLRGAVVFQHKYGIRRHSCLLSISPEHDTQERLPGRTLRRHRLRVPVRPARAATPACAGVVALGCRAYFLAVRIGVR
ncbi:hypothetical protein FBQ87_10850 [Sphingobacteriales bacterium CHB3]|nr:hypothetical protein [Sphingobacteriales bacterium CHB3]